VEEEDPSTKIDVPLDYLFRYTRDENGHPYKVADIAKASGLSATYIVGLRQGRSSNPTLDRLVRLARAFRVPTAYFVDPGIAEKINADLENREHGPTPAGDFTKIDVQLDFLFRTARDENRQPYKVVDIVKASGLTATYIAGLRQGRSSNPTLDRLVRLARAFRVPTAYFIDPGIEKKTNAELEYLKNDSVPGDLPAQKIEAQLANLHALRAATRDQGVALIAMRRLGQLAPDQQELVYGLIETLTRLQGLSLDGEPEDPRPDDGDRVQLSENRPQ
jgi:transcriptional regulator with XRE-family HTH domain